MLVRGRASARGVVLLAAAFTAQTTSGCLSNEYRIQKDDLRRLAEVGPEARGGSVRVSQTLGLRRAPAVEPPSTPSADQGSGDESLHLDGDGGGNGSAGGHSPPAHGMHGTSSAGGGHVASSPGPFHGTPTGAFHGAPSGATHGGGGFNIGGGGGGGGGGGDVLVVVAVVLVVAATVATVALAASEGLRFEGHARVTPRQLVYLKGGAVTQVVPLLELTREQAAVATSALVMDDEGDGLQRLDHAPLDRKGGVFRFDLGSDMFTFADARASGVSAHIQGGVYLTHTFGLVLDLGLAVATPDRCCAGTLAATGSISRHALGLEAQALPLALGPLHLGAFAGGGVAVLGASGAPGTGPMASAGALLEVDLTSHMALAVRGGANAAWFPSGLSTAGTLTGGLAIY